MTLLVAEKLLSCDRPPMDSHYLLSVRNVKIKNSVTKHHYHPVSFYLRVAEKFPAG